MNTLEKRLIRCFIGNIIDGIFGTAASATNQAMQVSENAKDRAFNAQQSQLQRDWQENMYTKYHSPQAQVAQRMAAGLNPTEGVTTQPVGTGSTASSSSSPLPGIGIPNIFSSIVESKLSKARTKQSIAEAQKIAEETAGVRLDNFKKQVENVGYKEAIQTQRALLLQQYETGLISYRKMRADLKMFESFASSGGNTYSDESNALQALTSLRNAQTNTAINEASKILAETAFTEARTITESFYQKHLNAKTAYVSHKDIREQLLAPFEQNAIRIANQYNASKRDIARLEKTMKELETSLFTDGFTADNWRFALDKIADRVIPILVSCIADDGNLDDSQEDALKSEVMKYFTQSIVQ